MRLSFCGLICSRLALLAAGLFLLRPAPAAEAAKPAQNAPAAPPNSAQAVTNAVLKQLQVMVGKINTKLQAGKRTEADLAENLKEFDDFIAGRKDDKSEEMAQVVWMKAQLYVQVFDDLAKAREVFAQVKTDYPQTMFGKQADEETARVTWGKAMQYAQVLDDFPKAYETLRMLKTDFPQTTYGKQVDGVWPQIERLEAARKIQRTLVVGSVFPDFLEQDVAGRPLSVSSYKGKVVLVDFWATWCGPCIQELPNVISAYQKHRTNGFEIIGISLDQDAQRLKEFTSANRMTWQQYFDGPGFGNKLAAKYGVNSIPATYLLDGEGRIIAKDLRGPGLEAAVAEALAKKRTEARAQLPSSQR